MSEIIEINVAEIGIPGVGVPSGGTTGQVLVKSSDADFATVWAIGGGGGGVSLGETSTTAYRGDRGKTAYDHSQVTGNPHGVTKANVGLGDVPNLAFSGSNTGDESESTIKTKLGVTTLSGSNTGDETESTIKTKLGITTLSGSNTGDQTFTRAITLEVSSTEIIATGEKLASVVCPVSGTINRWRMMADASTAAVISVWKDNAARPTVAGIITGSAKPTLSAESVATGATLTGWTTAVAVGDVFVMSVDSNTAAKFLSVSLEII